MDIQNDDFFLVYLLSMVAILGINSLIFRVGNQLGWGC